MFKPGLVILKIYFQTLCTVRYKQIYISRNRTVYNCDSRPVKLSQSVQLVEDLQQEMVLGTTATQRLWGQIEWNKDANNKLVKKELYKD